MALSTAMIEHFHSSEYKDHGLTPCEICSITWEPICFRKCWLYLQGTRSLWVTVKIFLKNQIAWPHISRRPQTWYVYLGYESEKNHTACSCDNCWMIFCHLMRICTFSLYDCFMCSMNTLRSLFCASTTVRVILIAASATVFMSPSNLNTLLWRKKHSQILQCSKFHKVTTKTLENIKKNLDTKIFKFI